MKTKIPFLAVTLIIAGSLIAGSCSGNSDKLYIYNWTYYIPDSIIEQFEEEYGVTVIYDEYASNEEMFAKLRAGGGGYDLVFPSEDYVSIMISHGMLRKLDKSQLSNMDNLDPRVLNKVISDPNMDYSVPYYFGAA